MDPVHATDRDLQENMASFEAALSAQEPALAEPPLRRVLLALDGSNQDATAEALVAALAQRAQAEVHSCYAYPGGADPSRERYLEERIAALRARGLDARRAAAQADHQRPPFEQIIEARRAVGGDLIALCAPYLDDFAALGRDSVGTTLDVLLGRASVPLLAVREPKQDPAACLSRVLLPITPYSEHVVQAAGWALRVVAAGGALRLLAVVDREELRSAGELLRSDVDVDELDERQLAGLQRPKLAGLIGGMQRRAAEAGLACRVSVRSGELVEAVAEMANAEEQVLVTGCPCRPAAPAFQRMQALARESGNPILIVPAPHPTAPPA